MLGEDPDFSLWVLHVWLSLLSTFTRILECFKLKGIAMEWLSRVAKRCFILFTIETVYRYTLKALGQCYIGFSVTESTLEWNWDTLEVMTNVSSPENYLQCTTRYLYGPFGKDIPQARRQATPTPNGDVLESKGALHFQISKWDKEKFEQRGGFHKSITPFQITVQMFEVAIIAR